MTSRFGFAFQTAAEGEFCETVIAPSGVRVIKGIDIDKLWGRNIFPRQRVIARQWIGGDGVEAGYMMRGAEGAAAYFDLLLPRYDRLISMDIRDVCGPNEPGVTPDNWKQYEAFELKWALLCGSCGLHPWLWSFSAGTPGLATAGDAVPVARFAPSIQAGINAGGGLETHNYGAPGVLSDAPWFALRYRKVLAELHEVKANVPWLLIGEAGIDGGVVQHPTRKGWRDWSSWGYPAEHDLLPGGMTEERYWRQMSAFDDEACRDWQVLAITPFVTHPLQKWQSFDFNYNLIRRAIAKHTSSPPPVIPPVIAPDPDPVGPPDDDDLTAWIERLEYIQEELDDVLEEMRQ